MLGAVLGDIIGSPYEFDSNNVKSTVFPLFSEYSRFTDDTVMTCAVAKALTETLGMPDTAVQSHLIQCMLLLGRKYPNAGYGGKFCQWLSEDNPKPYNSWGNGSAMRVAAVGRLFSTMGETMHMAELTASVSHNHPEGIRGAQATAAAMFLARAGAPKQEIARYITEQFGYDLRRSLDEIRPDYTMDVSCQGSVPIALRAFIEGKDYESTVRLAVSVGGDSDTIACIAGAIAECRYGIPDSILLEGLKRLDNPLKIICRDYLQVLKGVRPPRESWQSLVYKPAAKTELQQLEDALTVLHEASDVSVPQNRLPSVQLAAAAIMRNCEVLSPFQMDKETMVDFFGTDDVSLIADAASRGGVQSLKKQVKLKLMTIHDSRDEIWMPVFTSREQMDKGGKVSAVNRPFGTLSREVSRREDTAGVVINPFGYGLNLRKQMLSKLPLLRMASCISLLRGDITKLPVDAVVNAANESLLGGSGVDGAIHAGAGKPLLEECRGLQGCQTGEAVLTLAHGLPSRYILHTVGPVYSGTKEDAVQLASCYRSCLDLAASHDIKSIVFPCISTGVFGYPAEKAARVAIETVDSWLKEHTDKVLYIYFCCFTDKDYNLYRALLQQSSQTVTE